jgi:AraC family transcriptional activator of pobA
MGAFVPNYCLLFYFYSQQHIHNKLIEKAKEALTTTNLSVSEIAYHLGFEHPQSFNKLFKSKMNISPLEYRASFN